MTKIKIDREVVELAVTALAWSKPDAVASGAAREAAWSAAWSAREAAGAAWSAAVAAQANLLCLMCAEIEQREIRND